MNERAAAPSTTVEYIKEQERARIARELHDELGGQLTGIKMALAHLRQQLRSPETDGAELENQTDYLDKLTDDAINAMHDIIDELHPAVLALGLPATLDWLTRIYHRQTGIVHELAVDADWPALDTFSTVSLYRIVREALHNAARHAAASKVQLTLRHTPAQLKLEIIDDGIGLPPHAAQLAQSSGIRGMHARAVAMGATLMLLPGEPSGLKLQVLIPLTVLTTSKLIE